MLFSKSIVLGVTFAVSALAQKVAFTSFPSSVQAGTPTIVTWSTGDSSVSCTTIDVFRSSKHTDTPFAACNHHLETRPINRPQDHWSIDHNNQQLLYLDS